jgi:hypothetical protein
LQEFNAIKSTDVKPDACLPHRIDTRACARKKRRRVFSLRRGHAHAPRDGFSMTSGSKKSIDEFDAASGARVARRVSVGQRTIRVREIFSSRRQRFLIGETPSALPFFKALRLTLIHLSGIAPAHRIMRGTGFGGLPASRLCGPVSDGRHARGAAGDRRGKHRAKNANAKRVAQKGRRKNKNPANRFAGFIEFMEPSVGPDSLASPDRPFSAASRVAGHSQFSAPPVWYSMTRVSKKLRSFFRSIISLIQGKGFSSWANIGSRPICWARRLAMKRR